MRTDFEHYIPLNRLADGQRGVITEVVGRSEHVQRLKELGLRRGVELEMIRAGSPCMVRLQGHTLCIRGNELLNVLVVGPGYSLASGG
jgi:Fe2+ transport system protein FeoA